MFHVVRKTQSDVVHDHRLSSTCRIRLPVNVATSSASSQRPYLQLRNAEGYLHTRIYALLMCVSECIKVHRGFAFPLYRKRAAPSANSPYVFDTGQIVRDSIAAERREKQRQAAAAAAAAAAAPQKRKKRDTSEINGKFQ